MEISYDTYLSRFASFIIYVNFNYNKSVFLFL